MSIRNESIVSSSGHQHVQQLLVNLSKSQNRHISLNRANHSEIFSERSFTLNISNEKTQDNDSLLTLLKSQIEHKTPWKGISLKHHQDPLKRLNHKYELDNWEISRIQLSKRSYDCPKSYKGIKIPASGKQFGNLTERDKQGHLPYLYPNQIKKYESLKQKLSINPFKVTNSVRREYFGFGKQKYLIRKQHNNQSALLKANKRSYELSLL